jgi:hypothetical protein
MYGMYNIKFISSTICPYLCTVLNCWERSGVAGFKILFLESSGMIGNLGNDSGTAVFET